MLALNILRITLSLMRLHGLCVFNPVFLQYFPLPQPILTSNPKQPKKFGAFEMVGGGVTSEGVTKPITHGGQFFNFAVQLVVSQLETQ